MRPIVTLNCPFCVKHAVQSAKQMSRDKTSSVIVMFCLFQISVTSLMMMMKHNISNTA